MKLWRVTLPLALLILFELAVGILLFVEPEGFTTGIIVGFGILMLAVAAFNLVRFLHERRTTGQGSALALFIGVLTLLVGCLCAFGSGLVKGIFAVAAMIYGVILLVAGVFKFVTYIDRRQNGWHPPVLSLVGALLSVLLGLLILINPFEAANAVWMVAGVALIVEAVFDLMSLVGNIYAYRDLPSERK